MAGYTTGLELEGRMQASKAAAEDAKRKRKAQIEEDKKDAIEGVYPEALLLGGSSAARLGTKTVDKGLEALAARQGPLTTEKIQKLWPDIAPGKMPPTKTYLDEVMGVRSPKAKSMTAASKARRNAEHRGAAEATDTDLSEYYRGLEKAKKDIRGLGDEPNTTWRNMFKKGGSVRPGKVRTVMHEFKTGKLKSSSGQKVTNPKQAIAIAMSEAGMKKAKKFAGKDGSYVGGMSDKEAKAYADTELRNQREMAKARAEELRQRKSEVERKAGKHMQSIRQSQEDSSFTTMPYKKGGKVGESKAMAKKEISFMKRKGAPKSMIKHEKEEYGMKKGGACMADGGMARRGGPQGLTLQQPSMGVKTPPRPPSVKSQIPRGIKGRPMGMKSGGGIDGVAKKGKTKTQHFAKGGSVSARADGIATKGKTACKIC